MKKLFLFLMLSAGSAVFAADGFDGEVTVSRGEAVSRHLIELVSENASQDKLNSYGKNSLDLLRAATKANIVNLPIYNKIVQAAYNWLMSIDPEYFDYVLSRGGFSSFGNVVWPNGKKGDAGIIAAYRGRSVAVDSVDSDLLDTKDGAAGSSKSGYEAVEIFPGVADAELTYDSKDLKELDRLLAKYKYSTALEMDSESLSNLISAYRAALATQSNSDGANKLNKAILRSAYDSSLLEALSDRDLIFIDHCYKEDILFDRDGVNNYDCFYEYDDCGDEYDREPGGIDMMGFIDVQEELERRGFTDRLFNWLA